MEKILGTFYKGNSKRFGDQNWNRIKDNYDNNNYTIDNNKNIDTSKSQSIYDHNYTHQKYNHISPNLIRMQYFNNYLDQFKFRRNLHMQDYINNGIYNVYQGASDPLMERRKDVQNKLNNVRNKLLNEEAERVERWMKKVDEENKILDDLILEKEYDVNYNKNKDELALHLMENFDDKDFEKIYNDKEQKKLEELKSFKSNNNESLLVLSRTHSASSIGMDLLDSSEEENDKLLNQQNRGSMIMASPEPRKEKNEKNEKTEKKEGFEKFGRRMSAILKPNMKGSIKMNKEEKTEVKKKVFQKYPHTDILKILSHLDKYSVPIDNVNKELVKQSRIAPQAFEDLYEDIINLKQDFKEKMANYNEQNIKNMNILNEVLYELKIKKDYLELEADLYQPKINKVIEDAIDKYTKRRFENEFKDNLMNEKEKMENDFNIGIKLTERARKANKLANNLVNEVENVNNIYIKPSETQKDMISILSNQKSNNNDNTNIKSKNSLKEEEEEDEEKDIFPALNGLKESSNIKESKTNSLSYIDSNKDSNKESKKSKIKKRRVKRKVEIKDLGEIGDNDYLYKDNKKLRNERKVTVREDIVQNVLELNREKILNSKMK